MPIICDATQSGGRDSRLMPVVHMAFKIASCVIRPEHGVAIVAFDAQPGSCVL